LKAGPEVVIWSIPVTKGWFKPTVVQQQQITTYRVIQGSSYLGLELLEDIIVINQHRVSNSNFTSVGGYSTRFGIGSSKSKTVGDVAFIYEGTPTFIFRQIPDPQGVARLAKAARKRILQNKKAAEKMNKALLKEEQRRERYQKAIIQEQIIKQINTDKFVTWQSNAYGVKINYPSNWGFEKNQESSRFVVFKSQLANRSDIIFESVSITLLGLSNESPQQIAQKSINDLEKNYHDFILIESAPTILAGRQAQRVLYDIGGKRYMGIITNGKNGKIYQITFVAEPKEFDSYLPIVQKMVDSFEII
jgi:hypothetical protein